MSEQETPKKRLINGSLEVPEGMSKSAFKRELKKKRFAEGRAEWIESRREKRKEDRQRQRLNRAATGQTRLPKNPKGSQKVDMDVILDCDFVDYMKDGELVSLSRQIELCYSRNRRAMKQVNLHVNSVKGALKERFEDTMSGANWTNIDVTDAPFEPKTDGSMIYLSSDSDTILEKLSENHTYIIGGIVDKGRYKNLCQSKAQELGIPTARLPIDEHIKLSGRRVLTTNHVFDLILKWLEVHDWKLAFEAVLPSRKLGAASEQKSPKLVEEGPSSAPPQAAEQAAPQAAEQAAPQAAEQAAPQETTQA